MQAGRPPCGRGGGGEALFTLLLGAQVIGVATLLAALDSVWMQVCITLAAVTLGADDLNAVVLLSKLVEGGLHDATLQTKHQVQGRL